MFFYTSRRRRTRCALVTGGQTCALPICSIVWNAASKSRTRPARIGQIGGTHDMRNTGTPPRHASVDIRLRNGSVPRGINPKDWRRKPWRAPQERKRVVKGKSVSGSVDLGGRRSLQHKRTKNNEKP